MTAIMGPGYPPPGSNGPGSGSTLVYWRGHGGTPATPSSIVFDKQLDKISLWVEQWNHDMRCRILKKLLRESSYGELQLLWTVIQPILHRDFMYTASKQFPAQSFLPISTHIGREVNEQYIREQQPEYHRIQSAHLQLTSCRSVVDFRLPSIGRSGSNLTSNGINGELRSGSQQRSLNSHVSVATSTPSQPMSSPSRMSKHSYGSKSSTFSKSSTISKSTRLSISASHASNIINKDSQIADILSRTSKDSNLAQEQITSPCLRFLEMPVRRHMQEENSPRHDQCKNRENTAEKPAHDVTVLSSSACLPRRSQVPMPIAPVLPPAHAHITSNLSPNFTPSQGRVKVRVKVKVRPKKGRVTFTTPTPVEGEEAKAEEASTRSSGRADVTVVDIPVEGRQVLHWYTSVWNELQRNEFIHKLLLKLDPRQHYYLSSLLAMLHHVDIIGQAPTKLALKILSYLSPKQLCICSRVSRKWYRLCSNNDIWKRKCDEICLEIPVTSSKPVWKKIFRDNKEIVANWKSGNCAVVECKGHSDKVLSLTMDTWRMATGSADKTIKIWDVRDGRCLQTLRGHSKGIWGLRFFTDDLIISASYDSTIRIWSLREGNCMRTLIGHEGAVWAIERRGNILVSASQDGKAKVWDISRCMLMQTLRGHGGPVFCIDLDEEGSQAVTGSSDRTIRLWSTETGRQLRVIWVSSHSVMAVSYSKGWIACSHGNSVSLYNKLGRLHLTYEEHLKRVECLELKIKDPSQPSGLIISAGKDGAMKQWDIAKGTCAQTFAGSRTQVNCVHFDEMRIASAAYDNKIKIWDFTRPQPPTSAVRKYSRIALH